MYKVEKMDEKVLNSAKVEFEKLKEKAKDFVGNNEKLKELVNNAEEKIKSSNITDKIKDIPDIFSMIKSYVTGEYKDISPATLVAIVAALLYLITSEDIISDKIPVLGLVDDAAIIFICMQAISTDLEKYKTWIRK